MCAQLCPTLCHPMNCSPPGFPVHGVSQARILECISLLHYLLHFLLQGIFPAQGSNPCLLHLLYSLPLVPPGKALKPFIPLIFWKHTEMYRLFFLIAHQIFCRCMFNNEPDISARYLECSNQTGTIFSGACSLARRQSISITGWGKLMMEGTLGV